MVRLTLAISMLLGLLSAAPPAANAQASGLPPDQSLASVSCPSPDWCMAVGSQSAVQYGAGNANTRGLAERWTGAAWTEVPLPQAVTSVSCTSPNACTAVGGPTAERWDGTSWTVQSMPLPPDSFGPLLSGVSCASDTLCIAVGGYYPPSVNGAEPPWHTLIEVWNGTGWSSQMSPAPQPSQVMLTSVSCSSPVACTAVGKTPDFPENLSVVERWDGTAWTEQPIPGLAAYPGTVLTDVMCSSATVCTAIGSDQASPSLANPVAGQWNGSGWSFRQMPLPAGVYISQLNAISCSAAASCVAVGFYTSWTGPYLSLVERWNGSQWTIQPAPDPAGSDGGLSSVVCPSAETCVAVGWYWFNSWGRLATIQRWDGSSWAIQPDLDSRTTSSLEAVSCSSTEACVAVGNQQAATGIAATLAEQWTGREWTTLPTPNPAGALSDSLEAVSCASARACTAVGSALTSDETRLPLVERWDGRAWTIEATPAPRNDAISSLSGVACASARMCLAVGSQQIGATSIPLMERRDGTRWSLQSFPLPSGVTSASLSAISCSSASACTAVGSERYSDRQAVPDGLRGETLPLVVRWNGSAWTAQQTPTGTPTSRPPTGFNSVSCPAATACFAVGNGWNSALTSVAIAERWNGKRWSTQRYPQPAAITAGTPESVACSSASACSAVSFASSTGPAFVPVIGRWNGKRWRAQSPATPPGAAQTQLIGISCPARSECLSTGNAIDSSGNQLPVAEHWNGSAWAAQMIG